MKIVADSWMFRELEQILKIENHRAVNMHLGTQNLLETSQMS